MTAEYKQSAHAITGYVVIRARMKTTSPLRIGSGKEDRADVEVIRLGKTNEPYVPASGMIGALAHRYQAEVDDAQIQKAGEIFWGTVMAGSDAQNPQTWQSHLRAADMRMEAPAQAGIRVRDGVRINPVTNTAEEGMKFDYEMLEPGYTFTFQPEITLRAGFHDLIGEIRKLANYLGRCLKNDMRIGGLTTRGFGCLECLGFEMRHFDFVSGTDAEKEGQQKDWFAYLNTGEFTSDAPMADTDLPVLVAQNKFSIQAIFGLKSALMIGAPPGPDDQIDTIQLCSGGQPVISGTSLAGAIRHRALKVLQTLYVPEKVALSMIGDLFGSVDESADGKTRKRAIKSRVITHEAVVEGADCAKQTRIRIDRFTGGVIRSGLFGSAPVRRKQGHAIKLRIDIRRPVPWESALLMHVLKDLWTGDLAIGGEKNVGRGVLKGRSAEIFINKSVLKLTNEGNGILLEGKAEAKTALLDAEKAFIDKIHETIAP